MTQLTRLNLHRNKLTTLEQDAFGMARVLTTELTLVLENNPLQCDTRMCWVKRAEEAGLISWYHKNKAGVVFNQMHCPNYPGVDWNEIDLQCSMTGERFSK